MYILYRMPSARDSSAQSHGRKRRVNPTIIVVTLEEFEMMKDDEYSFVNEIVRTGYVIYDGA